MPVFINSVTVLFLILGSTLIFLISGLPILRHPKICFFSPLQQFLLSFIFGGVLLGLVSQLARIFGLDNFGIQGMILVYVFSALSLNAASFVRLVSNNWPIAMIWILYSFACVCFEVNQGINIKTFKLSDVQDHFALPIDNLLQFQTVRYLTEGISPESIDPVPNWKFGDRGPLMGIFVANIFYLLGITESMSWLNSSYPAAFVYESVSVVLNSLFLMVVYSLGLSYFGRLAGMLAVLLLIINPFVYINVVFTWPKFFAAGLALLSIELLLFVAQPALALSALLLGLGFLAHEGLIFSLPAIFIAIIYKLGFKKFFYFIFVFLVVQMPWNLYKLVSNQVSNSIVAHNMLCLEIGTTNELGIFDLISNEIKNHGLVSLLGVRTRNFIYPLDFSYINWKQELFTSNPLFSVSYAITGITFYQFIYALGFILVLFLAVRLVFNFKELALPIAAFFVTLLSVALFQGCELSTWNHIWCYLSLILMTLVISRELESVSKYISWPVVLLQGGISIIVLARYLRIIV